MSLTLWTDTRGMSQLAALGLLLGAAFVLVIVVGVLMLAAPS